MFVLFFYPFLIVHSKTKKKNFIQKKTPFVRYNSEVLIHLYGFIEPLPVANVRKIENWNIKIATTKKSVIIKIVIYKTKKKDQLLSIKRKTEKKTSTALFSLHLTVWRVTSISLLYIYIHFSGRVIETLPNATFSHHFCFYCQISIKICSSNYNRQSTKSHTHTQSHTFDTIKHKHTQTHTHVSTNHKLENPFTIRMHDRERMCTINFNWIY